MAFSNELAKAGTPPTSVKVTVAVTGDKLETGWTVLSSAITVRAVVPGATNESFQEAAAKARDGCPISKALKGNVELSVDATLES
jgi:osmotically inducible protein OsmC